MMIKAVQPKPNQSDLSAPQPILEAKGISKVFGHVQALDNVDFELYPNEVVALIGDNGAGKSTLVKILSGIYHKDAGQLYFEGQPIELRGPKDAERIAGISTVYQDLALVDVRDVGSNIFLNMEPTRFGIFINFKKLYTKAKRVIDTLRIDMPSVKVNVGVFTIADRLIVLRRGKRVGTRLKAETTKEEVVGLITAAIKGDLED